MRDKKGYLRNLKKKKKKKKEHDEQEVGSKQICRNHIPNIVLI